MKSFSNLSNMTILSSFLIGCETAPVQAPVKAPDPAQQLAIAMNGSYMRADANLTEPLWDHRVRIDPLGAGEWAYYQVNIGAALETVTRQRVLSLIAQPNGRVTQTAYSLTSPELYQSMGGSLSALTLDQLRPELSDGCDMIWIEMPNGWAGRTDLNDCIISSQNSQAEIRMGARADIIGNRFRRADAGYDLDGNRLWGFDDGEWMVLYRTP
jgi:hypothetical protein